jgi:hypothetical protein
MIRHSWKQCAVEFCFELERLLLHYLDCLAREVKLNMETRHNAVLRDLATITICS